MKSLKMSVDLHIWDCRQLWALPIIKYDNTRRRLSLLPNHKHNWEVSHLFLNSGSDGKEYVLSFFFLRRDTNRQKVPFKCILRNFSSWSYKFLIGLPIYEVDILFMFTIIVLYKRGFVYILYLPIALGKPTF